MDNQALDRVSVVLVEPQDDINIGIAVRAMRNFGISSLRLVRPASADARRIEISAPRCRDFIASIERFETVDEAVADCVLTLGLTARTRAAKWRVLQPRQAAREVVDRTGDGTVALVFGREDSGLPNRVIDRCHAAVTIPTNPDYSSMNLGQAVSLTCWEVSRMARGIETPRKSLGDTGAKSEFARAEMAGLERMFEQAEEALEAIEFFKVETNEHIMRSLRSVFLRAELDTRELAIWHGIFSEILSYLERTGRR